MLASKTELVSQLWRDGMIDGLTTGYALAASDGLHRRRLYFVLLRGFIRLAPRAYRRYLRAYARQGGSCDSRLPMLSFWQWRTDAANLAELAQISTGPGS